MKRAQRALRHQIRAQERAARVRIPLAGEFVSHAATPVEHDRVPVSFVQVMAGADGLEPEWVRSSCDQFPKHSRNSSCRASLSSLKVPKRARHRKPHLRPPRQDFAMSLRARADRSTRKGAIPRRFSAPSATPLANSSKRSGLSSRRSLGLRAKALGAAAKRCTALPRPKLPAPLGLSAVTWSHELRHLPAPRCQVSRQ